MEITLLFVVTLLAFAALLLFDVRAAFFAAILFYGIYPRFFAMGLAEDGFALTMQRAMLFLLLGMYVIRGLWGSPEIRHGLQTIARYRVVAAALLVYLLARLLGNLFSGRLDLGTVGQLISESMISLFIVLLAVTYIRTREHIMIVLGLLLVSLLFNQLIAVYEFVAQETVFPADLSLRYEVGGRGDAVLAGRIRDESFRAMGVFDNPLKLTALLGMTLPLVIYLATRAHVMLVRVLAGASALLALPTAFFSGSRAALGIVLLIFAWCGYRWFTRDMATRGRLLVAACGVAVGAGLLGMFADELIRELLFGDAYARSTEARLAAYLTVPLLLMEAPLFGFGYARNIVETLELGALDPFYLRLALEGGAISLAAFVTFLVATVRMLGPVKLTAAREADVRLAQALRLSLAVVILLALLLTLSYVRMYLFLLAGLAMALLEIQRQERDSASDADPDP